MKKIVILFIYCLSICSCSSLSKNMVKSGKLILRGGTESLNQDLVFKRYSWYQELTLNFDILITDLLKTDEFYQVFTSNEKDILKQCESVYIAFSYEQDAARLSRAHFLATLQALGAEEVVTSEFQKEMKMHPDFIEESLQLYRFHTLCFKKKNLSFQMKFPGFPEQKIL